MRIPSKDKKELVLRIREEIAREVVANIPIEKTVTAKDNVLKRLQAVVASMSEEDIISICCNKSAVT